MPRMSKADKKIEKDVEAAYRKLGSGVQISVFDLGKILDAGRDAAKAGQDIEEAIKAGIAKYRQN